MKYNATLYAANFNRNTDYFNVLEEDTIDIINTWKFIAANKHHDELGYLARHTSHKVSRFENILWRAWFIKFKNLQKIDYVSGLPVRTILVGPFALMSERCTFNIS